MATAHKIARIVYRMLDSKVEYHAIGAEEYEKRFREREIKYLPCLRTTGLRQRKAARLGLTLSPSQNVPAGAVS